MQQLSPPTTQPKSRVNSLTRIQFTVEGAPVSQPRPRFFRGSDGVVRGRTKSKHPIKAFRQHVAMMAKMATLGDDDWPSLGAVAVSILFRFRGDAESWHVSDPDIDNLVKGALDAVKSILWKDDRQVSMLRVAKIVSAAPPSMAFEVRKLFRSDFPEAVNLV